MNWLNKNYIVSPYDKRIIAYMLTKGHVVYSFTWPDEFLIILSNERYIELFKHLDIEPIYGFSKKESDFLIFLELYFMEDGIFEEDLAYEQIKKGGMLRALYMKYVTNMLDKELK